MPFRGANSEKLSCKIDTNTTDFPMDCGSFKKRYILYFLAQKFGTRLVSLQKLHSRCAEPCLHLNDEFIPGFLYYYGVVISNGLEKLGSAEIDDR